MASASAASSGLGNSFRPRRARTINANLMLIGAPFPRDGLFHLVRRVLSHFDASFGRSQEKNPSSLPHRKGGRGVSAEKQLLHCDDIRLIRLQQPVHLMKDLFEPFG